MKKYFNKELPMANEDNEDFENSQKCWICDNVYVEGKAKVRNHYYITRKMQQLWTQRLQFQD